MPHVPPARYPACVLTLRPRVSTRFGTVAFAVAMTKKCGVHAAGVVALGVKVWLQLEFHGLLCCGVYAGLFATILWFEVWLLSAICVPW